MREHEPIFLLRGVGGSHAHGLATATSDRDLIGVYSYPTEAFWSLSQPPETITGHEPEDHSYHELAKFLRLAAKSNPTVLELLWLDEYEQGDEWGDLLVGIRGSFNTAHDVRNAYIGYAESQFRKMMQAGNSDSRARSPKNARHMIRLMEQGQHLYTTGGVAGEGFRSRPVPRLRGDDRRGAPEGVRGSLVGVPRRKDGAARRPGLEVDQRVLERVSEEARMRYTENYPVVRYHEYEMSADRTRLVGSEVNIVAMWNDKSSVWQCSDGIERSDEYFRSMGAERKGWYTSQVAAVAWQNAESKLKGERKSNRILRAERRRIIDAWLRLAWALRQKPDRYEQVKAAAEEAWPTIACWPPEDYWHGRWNTQEIMEWSDHRGEVKDREQQEQERDRRERSNKFWAENRRKTDETNRQNAKDVLPSLRAIPDPPEAIQAMIKSYEATLERTRYLEVSAE